MKINYVYGLQDPRDNKTKYIGCTSNIEKRLLAHLSCSNIDTLKSYWINHLKEEGLKPSIFCFCSTLDRKNAEFLEKVYIHEYSKKNIIYNIKDNPFYRGMNLIRNGELLKLNPLYKQVIKSIEL